jgi:phospholipid/cholesterol/gamma-HCH transport system substrate-binding protein
MKGASEVRVGLFTALALAAAVYASTATTDNPFKDSGYELHARLIDAQGLKDGSGIELAGVRIGAVSRVYVDGTSAIADLSMDSRFSIPADSRVSVGSRGLLGDTIVKVHTGTSTTMLLDGDWIRADEPIASLQDIQAELGDIAGDVKAITGSLRAMLDTEETVGRVSSILANVDEFTKQVTGITAQNGEQISAVIDNMRMLTEQLNEIATSLRPQLDSEMQEIAEVTRTLNRGLRRVESIATRIDEGEGTLGKLVTDTALIDSITSTVNDIGDLVASVGKFQLEVYYRGEIHISPLRGERKISTKNLIGVRVKPRPDYWYVFEFVDDPLGSFSEEIVFLNSTTNGVREVRRNDKLQVTLQFAKRFNNLVLRLGIKESSGGVGADVYLWNDRITLRLDIFDFTYASWPSDLGIPNVKFAIDFAPIPHVYLTAGLDNFINGIVRQEPSWFVGGGVFFDDNDLKWILSSVPTGAL